MSVDLAGREAGKYVRANLYTLNPKTLVTTKDLTDNGDGSYDNHDEDMSAAIYEATYDVYDDAGYTELSCEYPNRGKDTFTISLEQTILNQVAGIVSDPHSAVLEASENMGVLESTLNSGELSGGDLEGNLDEGELSAIVKEDPGEANLEEQELTGTLDICE